MFHSILMVCVGNICRSPMAEGLMRREIERAGSGMHVASAGVGALVGEPADPMARELMAEQGIDIEAHRARQLGADMVRDHDLILVMEEWQRRKVESTFPMARGRVMCLGHWRDLQVPDPYRQPRSAFEHSMEQIQQGLEDWKDKLW